VFGPAGGPETLGRIGTAADALPALVALRDHRYWNVRAAGLRGLLALVERGEGGNLDALRRELRGFALTATDFRPEFTIRTTYARVIDAMERRRRASP
jgi:hypothetical protein